MQQESLQDDISADDADDEEDDWLSNIILTGVTGQ